jgi:hypothetical protein
LWVIFALLDSDPDSESGSGSTGPIESGSNPDPTPCKLQEKPSALKIEQPALKKNVIFYLF